MQNLVLLRSCYLLLLVLFAMSCQQQSQPFELFVPVVFRDSLLQQELAKNTPKLPESIVLQDWGFAVGAKEETLIVAPNQIPTADSMVKTPHRLNLPNTPMWYFKKIKLENASQLLVINADDGAQVFYGGKQVLQSFPDGFKLEATSDSVDLAIRVLNNAVEGGLRKAALMDFQEGIAYFSELSALKLAIPNTTKASFLFAEPLVQRLQSGVFSIKIAVDSSIIPELMFGTTATSLSKKVEATEINNGVFTFLLSDLQPDTIYYYQIGQQQYRSKIFPLRTDVTTLPFRFSAWGDSQGGWKTFQHLTNDMLNRNLAFSIGLGDLVADGSEKEQWLGFLYALQPLSASIPIYPVIGNHDYDGYYDNLIPELYRQHIRTANYFAWQYNNCYFVALDPNERFPLGIEGKQREWFYEQIASDAWKQADWRFILLHQPPYAQGWEDYHGDDFIRQLVEENAATAKIDIVLSGHSHCYERLSKQYDQQRTHFLILGGAGGGLEPPTLSDYPKMDTIIKQHHYGLFEVNQNYIDFQVVGRNGTLLDKIRLSK